MKKVFLSALVAASLVFGTTSCSKDDETKDPVETKDDDKGDDKGDESPKTAKGTVSFKFNGSNMSYAKLTVKDNPVDKDAYLISGTKTDNGTIYVINLIVKKSKTGDEVLESLTYNVGTTDVYSSVLGGLVSNVSSNSDKEIKASFSGDLKNADSSKTGKFTEGIIDIKFE